MIILYVIAFFSLIIGMGAIFTLVEKFPIKLLYYHYHFRKPLFWSIFIVSLGSQIIISSNGFPTNAIPPLIIIGLSVVLTYKVHQSNWFKAIYFPKMTNELDMLPLLDDQEMALIEYEGVIKAYPLDYVIHHHIVNGFKTKNINLKLKNNQIIEDTKTKTNWDVTGKYIIGTIESDLETIAISDEYWFSWKNFHPKSKLLRLNNESTIKNIVHLADSAKNEDDSNK